MASPGSQAASRTDQGSRGQSSGGKSSGSSGNSGTVKANPQAQVNRAYQTAPTSAPVRAGNATVADHLIATGAIRAPSIPSSGVAQGNYSTQGDAYNDYSNAVGQYATRGLLGRIGSFLAGPFVDQKEPMAGNPRSFANGTYHTASNPGGIVAGMVPYGGTLLGRAASPLYDASGLPDIWHGGYSQPDVRTGIFGNAPAGTDLGRTFSQMGGMYGAPGPANGQPGATGLRQGGAGGPTAAGLGQQNSAGDHLQQLAQLNSGIPGNPGAPVNSGTAPGVGMPGLPGPNYSQMLARTQSITPNYGVQLPGYQYANRIGAATV